MSREKALPLVSIVTPSYNQAAYLEHAIRSVLAQDYPAIEYLVVDGGSTDGSVEIIQKYAARLAWWTSEQDRGQGEAINKGLQRARGEVVAWLNSDDLYLPGAVAGAVDALLDNPEVGMVYGDAITIDVQGRPMNKLDFPDWGIEDLMRFRVICQPAVFMRRETLDRAGWLDTDYHYMLDHHLWLRIGKFKPIKHVPALWAAARHHLEAKNVRQSARFGDETLRLLEWMQGQEDLAARVGDNWRRVKGGAYRLNARYLLEGGLPGPALKAYGQALLAWPRFALGHWHRMIYALISFIGVGVLAKDYYRLHVKRRPVIQPDPGLDGWPGLCLEGKR